MTKSCRPKPHKLIYDVICSCNETSQPQKRLFRDDRCYPLSSEEVKKLTHGYFQVCENCGRSEDIVLKYLGTKLKDLVEVQRIQTEVRFVPVQNFRAQIQKFEKELSSNPSVENTEQQLLFG